MLSLEILNKDATLNTFMIKSTFNFVSGETAKIVMRLMQPDLKIRYIPDVAAVITVPLKRSDDTTLTKTATFPFADDRSIIQIELSAAETALVISQNLLVSVTEGANVTIATLPFGLSRTNTSENC
jgi:hypothetical protein